MKRFLVALAVVTGACALAFWIFLGPIVASISYPKWGFPIWFALSLVGIAATFALVEAEDRAS